MEMQEPSDVICLDRPGATLVAEQTGERPTILLLHAGGETRKVWHPIMTLLSGHGLSSIAYDQRGHGGSGGSPADGILAFGDDAKAMIRHAQKPVAVGASLGGFALMLALEECEAHASGLVLVDVTPNPDPERTHAYLSPIGGLSASPLVQDILSRAGRLTEIVARLRLPILLVCGGGDSPLGVEARAGFARLCPHAEIHVVEGAGHLVARDAPDELGSVIGEFAKKYT